MVEVIKAKKVMEVVVEVIMKVFLGILEVTSEEVVLFMLWLLIVCKRLWEVMIQIRNKKLTWVVKKLVEETVGGSLKKSESSWMGSNAIAKS